MEHITGVGHEALRGAAELLAAETPLSILFGPGFTASPELRDSLNGLAVLLSLTGSIGKEGGGMIPVYEGGNRPGASAPDMTPGPFVLPDSDLFGMLSSGRIKALYVAAESFKDRFYDSLRPFLRQVDFVVLHDTALPASGPEATGPRPIWCSPWRRSWKKAERT